MSGSSSDSSRSSSSSSDSSSDEDKKKKKKKKQKASKNNKKEKKEKRKKKKKSSKKDKKQKKSKSNKDPAALFSKNAQERARLEAQQRGMGITKDKKKKKKRKASSSSSSCSDSEEKLKQIRAAVEVAAAVKEKELLAQEQQAAAPPPEKPYDEMTWPERAAAAACRAENEAIWRGASAKEAQEAAEEAGEAVMRRAVQFGYVEPRQRAKFDAAKGGPQKKLSPVEQARSVGLHSVAFSSGGGPTFRGGGRFGVTAPKMTGGLEGGGYMS